MTLRSGDDRGLEGDGWCSAASDLGLAYQLSSLALASRMCPEGLRMAGHTALLRSAIFEDPYERSDNCRGQD